MKVQMEGTDWFYTPTVKKHFMHPLNFWAKDNDPKGFDAYGKTGNMKCGDEMKIWLKIKGDKIKDVKWKTFGCTSAIASTSMLSLMLKEKGGMSIKKALKIKPQDIVDRLGGLPAIKYHCSVLGDQALRVAVYDYKIKNNRDDIDIEKPKENDGH